MSLLKEYLYNIDELAFVSSIPPKAKPCFRDKSLIFSNEWFCTLRRRWKGEKGEDGCVYLNDILNSCDNFYRMCDNLDQLKEMKKLLDSSVVGIENVVKTYFQDSQNNVSKNYSKCSEKCKVISKNISVKITKFNKNSEIFFGHSPTMISSNII